MTEFTYTRAELEKTLASVIGETLGAVDKNNAFDKTINNPKVTGIAGDVVEKSILEYPSNSDQQPDIIVDGIPTEVKTTGIRYNTRAAKKGNPKKKDFEAKEPMSITAVSPPKIIHEEFESSNFWHKLEHMLLVYYHYNSRSTVKSWDYKNFTIEGYDFYEFSAEDREILKNDWLLVQQFIQDAQALDDPTERYPLLGSELRKNLMFIDTAPKWPHPPRFRLKRQTVTSMVQQFFGSKKYEKLAEEYSSFAALDKKLHALTEQYRGKSIQEICDDLEIQFTNNKAISGVIVSKMLGGETGRINNLKLFQDTGLILKTITQNAKGARTEDTKLFQIDFDELVSTSTFEDSQIYNYFAEHQFLFVMFQEPQDYQALSDNIFLGFKRLSFDDDFINNYVYKAWKHTRDLIVNNELTETPCYTKANQLIINKNGTVKTKLNFLKSKENPIFLRGSGIDSSQKPLNLCGINMYLQYMWVKGKLLVDLLSKIDPI